LKKRIEKLFPLAGIGIRASGEDEISTQRRKESFWFFFEKEPLSS
jgi:hypothetical protein